jgi:hypothetical protein
LTIVILTCIASCAGVTSRENFLNHEKDIVGLNVDKLRAGIKSTQLISEAYLENGNIEYRYQYLGCWRRLNLDSECQSNLDRGLVANS